MRIAVFGATGSVGSRIVQEALSRGHEITGIARNGARLRELFPSIHAETGDVSQPADVERITAGHDVVISATRPGTGQETALVDAARSLLAGVQRTGTRLVLVGGAASLRVPDTDGLQVIDDPRYLAPAYRAIAAACVGQLEACREHRAADWTYLSPPARLAPGERTGTYRLGSDELLVDAAGHSAISIEDLAVALMDEVEHPRHQQRRFTVAY